MKIGLKNQINAAESYNNCQTLTHFEVSEILGISERTLRNWRDEGLVPFIRIGRRVLYPKRAIKRLLKNCR